MRDNKVILVQVSSCSNTGTITDDPYWTSTKNTVVQYKKVKIKTNKTAQNKRQS